jgi:hypothetical protein
MPRELRGHGVLDLEQSALLHELVGELGRAGCPAPDDRRRHPDAEDAEARQQIPPHDDAQPGGIARAQESIRRDQQPLPRVAVECGELAERDVLALAERARPLGHQTRHGDHAERERGELGVALIPMRHPPRRQQRVDASGTDLVRPGQHSDRAHRLRGPGGVVVERLQELHVRAVQMPQQVDHRVGGGRGILRREEADGTGRSVLRQRGDAGGVDEDHRLQGRKRPADVDPLHLLRRQSAEVQDEETVLAPDRHPPRFADARMQCDRRRRREAVPGDHPRALARVGGGDPLAEHGVEERRFAGLHHSGQRQPQRFVQPLLELVDDLPFGVVVPVHVAGRGEQLLGDLDDGCRHEPARLYSRGPNPSAAVALGTRAPTGRGACSRA